MPERIIRPTSESLMDDNHSSLAVGRLAVWQYAANNNNLTVVWACSDSRLVLPYSTYVHLYSLTAAGPRSIFKNIYDSEMVKNNVTVCHHDGRKVEKGSSPGGCGARDAKEELQNGNGNGNDKEGAGDYIDRHVWHSDLFYQSFTAGGFTSHRSRKDTLAVSMDNRTLIMVPLQVFERGSRVITTGVPGHLLGAGSYFPESIYERGLPELAINEIPDQFLPFLKENQVIADELSEKYPNLADMQGSQNPSLLVLSTDVRPLRVRYPLTTEVPGSVFRISIPQQSLDDEKLIGSQDIKETTKQAQFPIGHFSNLHTILIETRNMDKSNHVAGFLSRRPWMKSWLSDRQNSILVGEVQRGTTTRIEYFFPKAA